MENLDYISLIAFCYLLRQKQYIIDISKKLVQKDLNSKFEDKQLTIKITEIISQVRTSNSSKALLMMFYVHQLNPLHRDKTPTQKRVS